MNRMQIMGPQAWRLILAAVFLYPFLLFGSETPQDILHKVEEALNTANTMKIDFEEVYEWKQTGEKQSIKGELILKGQNLFRVSTEDQVIVSDGVTLWTYSKPANRVLIDRIEKTDNATLPQQLFFNYRKDYQVKLLKEETLNGTPCVVLLFSAEKKDLFIVQIKAWIETTRWIPKKIEQTDLGKNKILYTLDNVLIQQDADASTFQFVIPENAEVIKL